MGLFSNKIWCSDPTKAPTSESQFRCNYEHTTDNVEWYLWLCSEKVQLSVLGSLSTLRCPEQNYLPASPHCQRTVILSRCYQIFYILSSIWQKENRVKIYIFIACLARERLICQAYKRLNLVFSFLIDYEIWWKFIFEMKYTKNDVRVGSGCCW